VKSKKDVPGFHNPAQQAGNARIPSIELTRMRIVPGVMWKNAIINVKMVHVWRNSRTLNHQLPLLA
jgi:hypothetical protein